MVDQGTMIKRFRPAPQGRAHRIRKHSCHVTISVVNATEIERQAEAPVVEEEETTVAETA